MLEEILDIRNIAKAIKQVVQNKGAGGVDGMQTDELRDFLNASWSPFRTEILEGRYEPCAVKRVEIPKADGGVRQLGIPTVKDRLIQQSMSQWMSAKWESEFSPFSYGFRPNKNAHQAVHQAKEYVNQGKVFVIELDLEKFFDYVNHDKLMSIISAKVTDKRTLRLIGKYLRNGVMENGLVEPQSKGTPQGSPLSPLLSNIMLHELDKELSSRGLSYVRYADDCSIYVSSRKSAERIMGSITKYIEQRLKLKVNKEKSKISEPVGSTLLGFSFYRKEGEWRPRIAKKSVERMRKKIKETFKRNKPAYPDKQYKAFSAVVVGWVNYFKMADCKSILQALDGFLRTRIRIIYWHKWKRPKTRMRNLLRLKVPKWKAYQWANSSLKSCRIAHSPILQTTLSNAFLKKQRLPSFYEGYLSKELQTQMF